jgi:hypothetical protein
MVSYNSMSPLPSLASILCSSSASFNFYALLFSSCTQHHRFSASLLRFILCATSTYYLLCHISLLQIMHCISSCPHASPSKKHSLFFVLHVFLTSIPLPDHHPNSSYSLAVILNLFIISGCYLEILWLLWKS